jgi:hypothetical protein
VTPTPVSGRLLGLVAAVLLVATVVSACGGSGRGGHVTTARAATSARPAAPSRSEAGRAVGTPAAQASRAKYGGLPSWLPKSRVRVNRIVEADAAHPQLAIEGDTVDVRLHGGRTTMTAVGPDVPEEGEVPVPPNSPCRFAVTFASVHGAVPIAARAFSFLGEHGQVNRARVTLRGGAPAPRQVLPGHPVTLMLSAVLPTGNGRLRWAPQGPTPIASWDFEVEID